MKHKTKLSDDSGSILADAMIGIMVAALTLLALTSITTTTSSALSITKARAALSIKLHSAVAAASLAPQTLPKTQNGVTLWLEGDTVLGGIPVAGPDTTVDCTVRAADCLRSQAKLTTVAAQTPTVTTEVPGVWLSGNASTTAPVTVGVGPLAAFATDPAAFETRFVLDLAATGAGAITVTDETTGTLLIEIPYTAGDTGFRYGSIDHNAGAELTFTVTGGSVELSQVYLYEVPA